MFWWSVCILYQPWYPGDPRLFLSLHYWVLSLVVQMLIISFRPSHILYEHKLNIVFSCVTIISAQWRPISLQGIALMMSRTAWCFRIFTGSSGTWMWWIRSLYPSTCVYPSGVTIYFQNRIGCSSTWLFFSLDCCPLMRQLLHNHMISYQRTLRHLPVFQSSLSNHLLFSVRV